jgi:type IV pilus assembly protein PilP
MLTHFRLRMFLAAPLLLLFAGCAERTLDDLDAYSQQVMARKGGVIDPPPEFRIVDTYLYQSAGNPNAPDPFKSILEPKKAEEAAVESTAISDAQRYELFERPKEELESFDLDSLRMVGTLQNEGMRWGIIVDPSGTVHRVQVGNYLGKNVGKVIAIDEAKLDLRELIGDQENGYEDRTASLALPEEP